jgi:hypothetical protein
MLSDVAGRLPTLKQEEVNDKKEEMVQGKQTRLM